MKTHNFRNLEVWKRGYRLAVDVCKELETEPFKGTSGIIEETRELSKILASLIKKLPPTARFPHNHSSLFSGL